MDKLYFTKIPNNTPDTLREYSRMFKERLECLGIKVSNDWLEDAVDDEEILSFLPEEPILGNCLSVIQGDTIHYGWANPKEAYNEHKKYKLIEIDLDSYIGILK